MILFKRANTGSAPETYVFVKQFSGKWGLVPERMLSDEGMRYVVKKDPIGGKWVLRIHGKSAGPGFDSSPKELKAELDDASAALTEIQLRDATVQFVNAYFNITGNPIKNVGSLTDPKIRNKFLQEAREVLRSSSTDEETPLDRNLDSFFTQLELASEDIQSFFPKEESLLDMFPAAAPYYLMYGTAIATGIAGFAWALGWINPLSWVGLDPTSLADDASRARRDPPPTEVTGTAPPPEERTEDPSTAPRPGGQTEANPPPVVENPTDSGDPAHASGEVRDVDETNWPLIGGVGAGIVVVGLGGWKIYEHYWGRSDEPEVEHAVDLSLAQDVAVLAALRAQQPQLTSALDRFKDSIDIAKVDKNIGIVRLQAWVEGRLAPGHQAPKSMLTNNATIFSAILNFAVGKSGGAQAQVILNLKATGFLAADFVMPVVDPAANAEEQDRLLQAARATLSQAQSDFIDGAIEVLQPLLVGVPVDMTSEEFNEEEYSHAAAKQVTAKKMKQLEAKIKALEPRLEAHEKFIFDSRQMSAVPAWAKSERLAWTVPQKMTHLFLTSPLAIMRLEKLGYLDRVQQVKGLYPKNVVVMAFGSLCKEYSVGVRAASDASLECLDEIEAFGLEAFGDEDSRVINPADVTRLPDPLDRATIAETAFNMDKSDHASAAGSSYLSVGPDAFILQESYAPSIATHGAQGVEFYENLQIHARVGVLLEPGDRMACKLDDMGTSASYASYAAFSGFDYVGECQRGNMFAPNKNFIPLSLDRTPYQLYVTYLDQGVLVSSLPKLSFPLEMSGPEMHVKSKEDAAASSKAKRLVLSADQAVAQKELQVAYIADHLRMISEQRVGVVTWITNQADVGTSMQGYFGYQNGKYGDFVISTGPSFKDEDNNEYLAKKITNNKTGEVHDFLLAINLATPDFGTLPSGAQIRFKEMTRAKAAECGIVFDSVPHLTHCTQGLGRTGTYVLADMAVKANRFPDKAMIAYMRWARPGMIQSPDQYVRACEEYCIRKALSGTLSQDDVAKIRELNRMLYQVTRNKVTVDIRPFEDIVVNGRTLRDAICSAELPEGEDIESAEEAERRALAHQEATAKAIAAHLKAYGEQYMQQA